MEAVAARIKEYVEIIYPDILEDLDISEDYLEFMVDDVIDRALVYTNRDQLVTQYEQDLEDYPTEDAVNDDFWDGYGIPIPVRVERSLANAVVGVCKNVQNRNTAQTGAITSISDNGQSISYSKEISNFLSSSSDAEIFGSTVSILDNFRIPTVVDNTDNIQKFDRNSVL